MTVTRSNLTDHIQVSVNGKLANFRRINDKSATIEMLADMDSGLVKVTFTIKNKTVTSLTLMNKTSIDKLSTLM